MYEQLWGNTWQKNIALRTLVIEDDATVLQRSIKKVALLTDGLLIVAFKMSTNLTKI